MRTIPLAIAFSSVPPARQYAVFLILVASVVCVGCSRPNTAGEANGNGPPPATPAPSSPAGSPSPEIDPLKVPERVASGEVTESGGNWNSAVRSNTYLSTADNTQQPMMFYKPQGNEPRPLLVGLHSWSETFRQRESVIYAEWAIANDWVFIHPNFRGPNNKPQATGSDLVIADVLSAIDYAKTNARVDHSRIYAVGWSGGGHLGLLLAGRAPEVWAGVSAWVPISDLNAWYEESRRLGTKYVSQIAASCGGRPTDGPPAEECRKRSPLTHLERARGIPIDINHGIRDGRNNNDPVPIGQSLRAFNLLAAPQDRITEEEIEYFTREFQVPPSLKSETSDPLYGGLKIHFRRQSGSTRVTVFDGAHDKNTEAAFRWLNQQRRR
ncbi:MAG TPA: prolyl oligopeptidase family serine peptidase [Pyrinomonadaceae bacterium]|nr:prolyl oligopeptidase family serine peptidase [Pyrinomonadaceae bacterium]